jgi:hypothetical protein
MNNLVLGNGFDLAHGLPDRRLKKNLYSRIF